MIKVSTKVDVYSFRNCGDIEGKVEIGQLLGHAKDKTIYNPLRGDTITFLLMEHDLYNGK